MSKKKILVSAYGCEPGRGSEAGVGWNWVLQMAREYDVYVIARANDAEKIEANIPNDLRESLHFTYYDTNKLFLKIKKGAKRLYIYYALWQIGIIKVIRRLKKEIDFDYAVHLTFGSLWMPTYLPFFKIPFIWGPVGGADPVPKKLIKNLPLKDRIVQRFRYFLIKTSCLNPRVAYPSRKAVAILCRTKNNIEAIPKKYRHKAHVIIETGMKEEVFDNKKDDVSNDKVEIAVVGRLIPTKNVEAAIDAFNTVKEEYENVHMTIIGDGYLRQKLEKKTDEYGLNDSIKFLGEVPREKVLENLKKSDIYFLPSLHEGGSWSLMEAMAVGLPTVCLDWTGMGVIVDENSGLKVKPSTYEETCQGFAESLKRLVKDEHLRKQMGTNARERIRNDYSWESKLKYISEIIK